MEHRSGHILSVLSLYQRYFCICNPNGTLFHTCLILHVWLKSIILVFANILNTFSYFFPIVFIRNHALHN